MKLVSTSNLGEVEVSEELGRKLLAGGDWEEPKKVPSRRSAAKKSEAEE